ncbi:LacI family DNA-binding transcriptional regulator [Kutzneria kofuensis]|uniref:DNA-binding LacI/PurR family transcriptional regulator n=1 Tax=Kutzneria kofuensis TaxID=103725 RepID=A0A7W9KCI6_9PSEU|nr:LacI family DNA-binding transcriptional regulator [Kutzneria kofuensis]MBB5890011.1 DNA-binding LacI/PurR family transcriptional regulator [Kutzneria kofuensis]
MATIHDVARAAGVAPSTVSYVISGKRTVSAATRRRVQQQIRLLGYRPRASEPTDRSNLLALLAPQRPGIEAPTLMRFTSAATAAARSHGLDLLLLTKDADPGELREAVIGSLADGLIALDVTAADNRVPMLTALDRPTVLVGVPDHPNAITCLDLDFYTAATLCMDHLAGLGHRTIGLAGPAPAVHDRGVSHAARFRQGFLDSAARHRTRIVARACGDDIRSCLDGLLDAGITALVVQNEDALTSLVLDLGRRGLDVPRDISVIAVGPHGGDPCTLTTVEVPAARLGELAVEMVVDQLDGAAAPEIRLLPPRLVARASTSHPSTSD